MANSIFRVNKNKDNPYVMMNKQGLQNEKLSWKAKGILAYLLTLPDDWKIYLSELETHAKDGRDSLSSGVQELIKFGYVVRNRLHDEKGKFKGYEYCVYEIPLKIVEPKTENPKTDNPETEKPYTENPQLLNNDCTNKLFNSSSNKEFIEIKKVFDQNIHPMVPIESDKLMAYIEDDGMDYRLIIKAIEIAVTNSKRNLGYIEGILKKWREANILTLETLEAYIRDRQDKKNKNKEERGRGTDADSNDNGEYDPYANRKKLKLGAR